MGDDGRRVLHEAAAGGESAPESTAGEAVPAVVEPDQMDALLRESVGLLLDAAPNLLAMRYRDRSLCLSEIEKREGVTAWVSTINAYWPDIRDHVKAIALLAAIGWTLKTAAIRVRRVRTIRKARRDKAAGRTSPGPGRVPEPAEVVGEAPRGEPADDAEIEGYVVEDADE